MRAPLVVRDFLEWRWTPCVALTVASLAWVGLAVLFIPNQFEPSARGAEGASVFDAAPRLPSTAFNSALTPATFGTTQTEPIRRAAPSPPPITANEPVIRRGFSPPLEHPEAPAPAPVPPPAAVQPIPSTPVTLVTPPVPALPSAPSAVPAATPPPSPAPAEDGNQAAPAPPQ